MSGALTGPCGLVLPRMKRDLVAMIEAQAEEAGLTAEGDGFETHTNGGGSKLAAAALGRSGVAEVGTRASAYAPSQSRGGMAAAMSGGGGGGGGVGLSSGKNKPLITFPDPGQLDGIKNKQQVVLRIEDLSFGYPTSPAPVLDGRGASRAMSFTTQSFKSASP